MANQTKRGRCLLSGLVVCLVTGVPVLGQEPVPDAPSTRVRAADRLADALLRKGRAESPTFAAMLEQLEGSDLVIYVETRPLKLPAQVQLVAASPTCRHLRVSVRTPGLETEQVAWLGHELWHAVEIADAPDVRDQASLRLLYSRIGAVDCDRAERAETVAAQAAGVKVLTELRHEAPRASSAR